MHFLIYVVWHSIDNPSYAVHLIVPLNRLDRTLKRLHSHGYEIGPEPSKEFYLGEGERLALSFHNNICFRDEISSLALVFFNNLDLDQYFVMKEVDRFLQKQFSSYRGVMQLSKFINANNKKETGRQTEDGSKNGDDFRMVVVSHQVNIPKVSWGKLQLIYDSAIGLCTVFCIAIYSLGENEWQDDKTIKINI